MTGCGTIGFKRIVRPVFIALQVGCPVFCKVLRKSPAILFCPGHYPADNSPRPFPVCIILKGICRSQKRFHCMHIGIHTPVVIHNGKFRIPDITGQTFFFIPEAKIIYGNRLIQQLLCPFPARQISGGCRQYDKSMGIALFCGKECIIRGKSRIPAAMLLIVQFSPKRFQCLIYKLFTACKSKESAQAVYMGHPACLISLPVFIFPGCPVIAQIIGTSTR